MGGGLAPTMDVADEQVTDQSGASSTVAVVRVVFPDRVFFDFDSGALRDDAGPVCDLLAENLRGELADVRVTVVGHTDAIGSDSYNIDLSRRRALSVMQALVARGVPAGALSTVAVGKRQPIASDATDAGRAENRRVEFLISPSVQANLAVVARRPVEAAYLENGAAPDNAVAVLRPAADPAAPAGSMTLAALGSIALNEPTLPPTPAVAGEAAVPAPASAPTSVPRAAAPAPAARHTEAIPVRRAVPSPSTRPAAVAPPAVTRHLEPDYVPAVPGAPQTY